MSDPKGQLTLTQMMQLVRASMLQSSILPSCSFSTLVRQFQALPPGKLFGLSGTDSEVFRIALAMASQALLKGTPIALVDGSNRFDVYRIAEFARWVTSRHLVKEHVPPEDLLRNIFVARAFTCYQMEATITERVPLFIRQINAPVLIIFSLLDTFYDEQAPLFEVKASLGRIIAALQRLKDEGVSVLLASLKMKLESKGRNELLPRIERAMDQVYRLEENGEGRRIVLIEERYQPQKR
jgi:hypothetical protein